MLIANPLYDTAFKGLIKNEEVAKLIISILLGQKVLSVEPRITERLKPQEENDKFPRCLRLDYTAVILDENQKEQKILIEMQKASGADTIMRFREYLAVAGYGKQEKREENEYPIVTIYFLGFTLDNVKTPCLKVARQYVDMLENKVLQTKEKFVELLTHDSIVIQTPRINTQEPPKTELEKILSVFEQKNFADLDEATINYKYPVEDDFLKKVVSVLHYIGTDPEERKVLDNEAYWRNSEERAAEKNKAEGRAEGKAEKALEVAKKMKDRGICAEEIAEMTGLFVDDILRI